MNEDFLHSQTSPDDSEETNLNMDWRHMRSLLDREMPAAPPFVVPSQNTSLWLKSQVVAALIGMAFLWQLHPAKGLDNKRTAEMDS